MKKNSLFRFNAQFFAPFEDDSPTQVPGGRGGYDDDMETQVPGGGGGFSNTDLEKTRLGNGQLAGPGLNTIIDIPETGTLAILWVTEGERRGHIFKIKNGDVVGRRDGDFILDDPKISTPHCRFRREKKKFVLWDCGSKNGTFVNNKQIRCATELEENDLIKIGDTIFVLKVIQ